MSTWDYSARSQGLYALICLGLQQATLINTIHPVPQKNAIGNKTQRCLVGTGGVNVARVTG